MIEESFCDCPGCGETIALTIDTTAGDEQEYVEDCPVCCRPMAVYARCRPGRLLSVSVSAD